MTVYNKYVMLSDVTDTIESAINSINTALITIANSKAELESLDSTFPDIVSEAEYASIKEVATEAIEKTEALVTDGSISFDE